MKIGLPRALLYYHYGQLWRTFFEELGCETLVSDNTSADTLSLGAADTIDENCLPLKAFIGHVRSLIGRCDRILVPRMVRTGHDSEYCVRFWGLPDLVCNTFPSADILSYNIDSALKSAELVEFIKMALTLRKGPGNALRAYRAGLAAQAAFDRQQSARQRERQDLPGIKILIAAQPYISHDPFVGGVVADAVRRQGGVPLFSDRCDLAQCRELSREISDSLYWVRNKEIIGSILLQKPCVDGVILLTAFPCGTDSLVNELVVRKIKDIPLTQILLDEHQAQAGLETRVESFIDILHQRRAGA